MLFLKIVLLGGLGFVVVRPLWIYVTCRSLLRERLAGMDVRLDSARWVLNPGLDGKTGGAHRGQRQETRLKFKGYFDGQNRLIAGVATINRYDNTMTFDYSDGAEVMRALLVEGRDFLDAEAGDLDLEQRIVFETNQRLERLIGVPEDYLKNDVNGDGGVDEEEWAAVRARVEKEVRAEMTGPLDADAVADADADAGW